MKNLLLACILSSISIYGNAKMTPNVPRAFAAEFTQKITNTKGKEIHYKGAVAFNRGRSIKWVYTSPTSKTVCSENGTTIVVDHDLEQVTLIKQKETVDIEYLIKNSKHYKDALYTTVYNKVTYTFQLEDGKIDQLAFVDALDNTVNIHFLNKQYIDTYLNDEVMQCDYPNTYDIIENKEREAP